MCVCVCLCVCVCVMSLVCVCVMSCGVSQAVSAGLQSEVKGLQDRVVELERGEEEERGEREKEKREAQATILSLTSQLETLRSEKEGLHKTQGERVCQVDME